MKLIASVYLDEDVDVFLAVLLQSRGLDVASAREHRQLGRQDAEQLRHASKEGRVLVTHNRGDFEELHRMYILQGEMHSGIIIAARRNVRLLCDRMIYLLDILTADEIEGQLFYV